MFEPRLFKLPEFFAYFFDVCSFRQILFCERAEQDVDRDNRVVMREMGGGGRGDRWGNRRTRF